MTATAATARDFTDAAPRSGAVADRVASWALLTLGFLAIVASGTRWGVTALAWVAPIPFLLLARRARRIRDWLILAGALVLAHSLQLGGDATAPVPWVALLPFSVPLGLAIAACLGLTEVLRRRVGEAVAIYGYAALVAVADWGFFRGTELGAWNTTANSQVELLSLMQLTAVTGLAGVGFLMAWVAAAAASLLGAPAPARRWRHAGAALLALVAALQLGALRLDRTNGRSVTVAAVVTDVGLTPTGLPSDAVLEANTETLFARTRLAAARGARLVVWNEVATVVEPEAEAALITRARGAARRLGIDLVVAYAVLVSRRPLSMDNKYAFITSDGEVADTYRKRHPVPGEPSLRGTEPARVLDRPYGRVSGGLCYDYDFPALAREAARGGAELVVVPASDWRGIDPFHTYMARVRAIEGGMSLVRSTRWGASGAFDAYGRVRGWMQVTEDNDRVMVTSVPVGRVATPYALVGDAPVAGAGAFLLVAFVSAARGRRERRGEHRGPGAAPPPARSPAPGPERAT